jgi:serine/threonine-protein kinase HipA
MPLPEITVCPSTLRPGFSTYSPAAQAALFGSRSRKVPHVLIFGPPGKDAELTRKYNEKRIRISISGVQEKYSFKQDKNNLGLTDSQGTHILKPIPVERLERITDLPANEHVSMQIAKQAFRIQTAENGMIFFEDGSPAYITRRFDYKPDGSHKYQLEDFASLLGKTPEREGDNFKYDASYLDIVQLIRKYAAAEQLVLLEFFRLLVVNYAIANGDGHLKNYALLETAQGDFLLAPAYDLLCTRLHLDDSLLALDRGLYPGDYNEPSFYDKGMYTGASFMVFAEKAGIPARLAARLLAEILDGFQAAFELVGRSFLSDGAKTRYNEILQGREELLRIM